MSWGHNQAGPGPGQGGPGFNPMGQNQPTAHPGSVMQAASGPAPIGNQPHPSQMGGQQMGNPQGNPQMGNPQGAMGNPAPTQNQPQMGQMTPQDYDDPIFQLKKMVPKLKESLHTVMNISSKVLAYNTQVDYTGDGERRNVQSTEARQELEKSFEQFYHTADLLEAQIKLAQQQCMNTLQAVSTVAANYVHFNKVDPGTRMPANFELSKYNDYIEIVRDQIRCANEASQILQRSYQDLQNIDIPGRRNPNTNNANNTRTQTPPAASTPGPVGSPAAAPVPVSSS